MQGVAISHLMSLSESFLTCGHSLGLFQGLGASQQKADTAFVSVFLAAVCIASWWFHHVVHDSYSYFFQPLKEGK